MLTVVWLTILCCFCTSESMHSVKCAASGLLQGLTLDPNRKMIPLKKTKNTRGHFVRTEGLLSHRKTESLDVAVLLQSEPSQDRDLFWLQATQLRSRGLFSIHHYWRATFIYLITVCFIIIFFLLRAGLNSVDFNCWVGTLKGLGLICNFSTSVDTRVIDYIYLYIRLRACYTCTYKFIITMLNDIKKRTQSMQYTRPPLKGVPSF